jgi:DNA polymerase
MCPGPDENLAGVPFVGRAGKILDLVLTQVFHRDGDRLYNDVYITNLVKCFVPPGTPLQKEWMDTCLPYFIAELGLLPAKKIILLGKDVSNYLLGNSEKIGALRGKDFEYMGIKTICTYHPSYIVRGGGEQADAFWEVVKDFNRIIE